MSPEEETRIERGDDWQAEGLSILDGLARVETTSLGCWTNDFDDGLDGSFEIRIKTVRVGGNLRDTVLNQREELQRLVAAYDEWLAENKKPVSLKRAS